MNFSDVVNATYAINPFGPEARKFQAIMVNTMAIYALAYWVARATKVMISIT